MKEYSVIVKRLTDKQKARLVAASGGWNKTSSGDIDVSGLTFADGAFGVAIRGDYKHYGAPTTRFPSPRNMARSWNLSLAANTANCIGNEAHSLGINALDMPLVGVTGESADGDDSTHFSEDPYLCGKMGAAYVRGIERNSVMAKLRFAEVNADVDPRALREIGLTPYEMALKEGKPSMLCIPDSSFGGTKLCQSDYFMRGVIGTEWQYGGVIVAEDSGEADPAGAFAHGVSMLLSENAEAEAHEIERGLARYKRLVDDVAAGKMSADALDAMVSRGEVISDRQIDSALERLFAAADASAKKAETVSDSYSSFPCNHPVMFDEAAHNRMALDAACETIVLLKNKGGVLPIKSGVRVAFVGEYVDTPLTELGMGQGIIPMENDITSRLMGKFGMDVVGSSAGYSNLSGADNGLLISSACSLAKNADVVVAYVGTLGLDDTAVLPTYQLELLRRLREESGSRIVAVCVGDVPADMSWNDMCDAVLVAGDAGQGAVRAVLKVLCGAVNPSGKLTQSVCDMPMEQTAGLHGYRLCQAKNVEERYPFGFGLSYTSFEYSELRVSESGVRFKITNTGSVAGAEVAQLYIGKRDSAVALAQKELKGFCKVSLEAGESKYVDIPFDSKAFRYYNGFTGRWECEGGTYQIYVASSSRSLALFEEHWVEGSGADTFAVSMDTQTDGEPKAKTSTGAVARTILSGLFIALLGAAAVLYMVLFRDDILRTVGIRPSSDTASITDTVLLVLWISVTAVFAWLLVSGIERLRRGKSGVTDVDMSRYGRVSHVPDRVYEDWQDIEFYTDTPEEESEAVEENEAVTAVRTDKADKSEQKETAPVSKTVDGRFIKVKHSVGESAQMDISALFGAVKAYTRSVGIEVSDEQLCGVLSALGSTRTVVVRSGSAEVAQRIIGAVAECLDATLTVIEANREDYHITDRLFSVSSDASVATAAAVAKNTPDRMSIVLISGADTSDMATYFGEMMRYTGNTASSYVMASDKWAGKTVSLPTNMWFIAVVDKDAPICCGSACAVELYGDVSGTYADSGEAAELNIYPLTVRCLADMVADARENSYLSEKYWRKIDRVEEYVGARCGFTLTNRTVNSIERYAAVCMSCGLGAEDTVDRVLAAFVVGALDGSHVERLNAAEDDIGEFMDSVFGADKDDRSRELLKVKGIR